MSQQPLRIVPVRSAEARERLAEHLSEGNSKKTAAAPLVAILAADHEFHEELPSQFPHFPQAKSLFAERAVRERSAKLNALLQVGYFIIGGIRASGHYRLIEGQRSAGHAVTTPPGPNPVNAKSATVTSVPWPRPIAIPSSAGSLVVAPAAWPGLRPIPPFMKSAHADLMVIPSAKCAGCRITEELSRIPGRM